MNTLRKCLFFASMMGISYVGITCKTTGPVGADSALKDEDPAVIARALEALALLGADVPNSENRCTGACHWHGPKLTNARVKDWAARTINLNECFKTITETGEAAAQQKIACMRKDPANPASSYDGAKLGLFRSGAETTFFKTLFAEAFPTDAEQARYKSFATNMRMPKLAEPGQPEEKSAFVDDQFEKIKSWALDGTPGLDAVLPPATGLASCTEEIKPKLLEHIDAMKTKGWHKQNFKNPNFQLFGCPELAENHTYDRLTDPLACLKEFPTSATWPMGWAAPPEETGGMKVKIKILRELKDFTTYWMRSSPDGRFVGNGRRNNPDVPPPPGGDTGGIIDDLLIADRRISIVASYDPGFFPDNRGFTFHGSHGSAVFCSQKLLENPQVVFIDPETTPLCLSHELGVYQHVAKPLDGSPYVVVRSDNYENDNGGNSLRADPPVDNFAVPDALLEVYHFRESETGFDASPEVQQLNTTVTIPFEGDWVISPSSYLVASRIAGTNASGANFQLGYRIRLLKPDGATINPEAGELGTICLKGGKPTFSFDERIMATHHYVTNSDDEDPALAGLANNSSNIYIYDMARKKSVRLTKMKAGQFALYPHFRSDGWLYFLVRDTVAQKHYIAATDAGLRVQK